MVEELLKLLGRTLLQALALTMTDLAVSATASD